MNSSEKSKPCSQHNALQGQPWKKDNPPKGVPPESMYAMAPGLDVIEFAYCSLLGYVSLQGHVLAYLAWCLAFQPLQKLHSPIYSARKPVRFKYGF